MIHAHRRNGVRCGGTLIHHVHYGQDHYRCTKCGQVGVPYIPPKTRSRSGESLADPARTASVLSLVELSHSIQVSNHSHKVIRR